MTAPRGGPGSSGSGSGSEAKRKLDDEHEILLLLAIFAATIAYVAGMYPPGGFWRSTAGGVVAGDPVLQGAHPNRYMAFFVCNSAAFAASLLAIISILAYTKLSDLTRRAAAVKAALYTFVVAAVLGLGGASAAGSCRDGKHTAYVACLVFPVLAYIVILYVAFRNRNPRNSKRGTPGHREPDEYQAKEGSEPAKEVDKICEYIQLLTLAATVAYQAGIDPPGGVWAEDGDRHRAGDPILLTTHPRRFGVFFYCNSAAFVASLVIMALSQSKRLVGRHHAVLEAAMILDLFGLIGAYAVGCCRDTSTSVYVIAMAGAVLVYVVIHIIFFTLDDGTSGSASATGGGGGGVNPGDEQLEKHREVLLLLAVLAATLTYQAGLSPPGGFWENDRSGHRAGFPVLLDRDRRRYEAFFYCNAASFMASVALIVLLLNRNLYRPGIQSYALITCMVAGMLGVMVAYAAGSSLHLWTFIVVLVLVLLVSVAVVYVAIYRYRNLKRKGAAAAPRPPPPPPTTGTNRYSSPATPPSPHQDVLKYLMLVGILAATVTYLTGLKPPGGLWRDSAGNPVLYDVDKRRYNAFFYSNSTSFMASITVIVLLLRRMLLGRRSGGGGGGKAFWAMHTAMVLDMIALLVAYAAGSARDWGTSKNVFLLLLPIQLFVGGLLFVCKKAGRR
uniref:PGG domain-containing protein n=1 Tax=Oryza brachyantha TaxID=4533 RepID=J3N6W4_ORYBR